MVQIPKAHLSGKSPKAEPAFRALELDILKNRLAAQNGSTVVLVGQRGVGKSRTAARLIRHATAQPNHIVFESRVRDGGGDGFEVWGEIVRQAIQWADVSGLSLAVIEPVINELDGVLQSHDLQPESHPSFEQKLKFFDAVLKLLSAICTHRRILLVIHDLDRANGDTLDLAQFISDNLFDDPRLQLHQQRSGLLLYSVRIRASNPSQLTEFLLQTESQPNVQRIELKGFDREGLRNYLQSEHILNKLLSASGGLPNQIDELLDGLPNNVETLFERRLANIPTEYQRVLAGLAIFERPATAHLLASALKTNITETVKVLRTLRTDKILERHIENGEIRFSFSRVSNQEVTIKSLSKEEKAQYHQGWAIALERNNDPSNISKQAYHFLHSAAPLQGINLAIRAADAQAVSGAFDAATKMLLLALPHAQNDVRKQVLTRLIELSSLRGQTRAAQDYLGQLKAILPEHEHNDIVLKEARLLNQSGEYESSIAILKAVDEKSLDLASVVILETTFAEAHYQTGKLSEAKSAGERGLDKLSNSPDDESVQQNIEIVNLLGKIAVAQEQRGHALRLFEQTLDLALEKGIGHSEARALINLGVTHLKDGNQAEAERFLKRGVETARKGDHLERIAFGSLNLGVLLHQKGDLSKAIEYYGECRSLFRRLGNRTQLARVMYNLGLLFRMVGDRERAIAHNQEALRIARECKVEKLCTFARVFAARLEADMGHFDRAQSELKRLLDELRASNREIPSMVSIEYGQVLLESGQTKEALTSLTGTRDDFPSTVSLSLRTRTQLLVGRCLSNLGSDQALKQLSQARKESITLKENLLLRDIEIALGEHHQSISDSIQAQRHWQNASNIQEEMAQALPVALRSTFEQAPGQQELRALKAMFAPRSNRTGPEKSASRPVTTRPSTGRIERPSSGVTTSREEAESWKTKYPHIIGNSVKLHKLFRMVDRIAVSENTVLITGESGTGKELVAEAIHMNSNRRDGPFIKLNCAALVESLLLSELFGHERGAFTGAHQRKIGRFEMAAGGTLFLDEIGDISPKTQVALLRILQEYEFERVGGGKTIKLNARVIFATNRNLTQMVREGNFREDLYYRLKGLSLEVPALRDRKEDICTLATYFLMKNADATESAKQLSDDAQKAIRNYRWPGNIRELENVIRSIALYADSDLISQSDLDEYQELFEEPPAFEPENEDDREARIDDQSYPSIANTNIENLYQPYTKEEEQPVSQPAETLEPDKKFDLLSEIFDNGTSLADFKKQIQDRAIVHALETTGGNITRAAEMLGMKRPRLSQIINSSERLKEMCQGVSK